jgi:hypothetical protein
MAREGEGNGNGNGDSVVRDAVQGHFTWTLTDNEGNVVDSSSGTVNNPFPINASPGHELRISLTRRKVTPEIGPLDGWYTEDNDGTKKEQTNTSGQDGNTLRFTIAEGMKGLILRYNTPE